MSREHPRTLDSIFSHQPDKISGSNQIYFEGNLVLKVLKETAPILDFCRNMSDPEKIIFFECIYKKLKNYFGDSLIKTRFLLRDKKIVTIQKVSSGQTLREIYEQESTPELLTQQLQIIEVQIKKLRDDETFEDLELQGFIIDELDNPENMLFDEQRLIIIDW